MSSWVETVRRPRSWLVFIVLALYGWTVTGPFFIDDFRDMRLMREYRDGQRSELGLYRFLRGGADNRTLRAAGFYPWWLADEVRYQHSRPLAERLIYGQFLIFGTNPLGYHCVSVALYAIGVLLVARLFSLLFANPAVSRWAAILFALAGAHAVPIIFVSMQCDLVGLILIATALICAIRWLQGASWPAFLSAIVLYGLALGAKESSLPAATLPILYGIAHRKSPEHLRRAAIVTGSMLAIGMIWLGIYAVRGFGANNVMMLDPLHDPANYFAELPTRALVLLSTWLLPINPFVFYLRPFGLAVIPVLAGIGVVTLLAFAWLIRSRGRDAGMMAAWTLLFLPLLACTTPDDRNILLPGVGFAALAAIWMVPNVPNRRLRWVPFFLFVIAQVPTSLANAIVVRSLVSIVERNLREADNLFGRETGPGDCIFFVNLDTDPQILFAQYHFDWLRAREGKPAGVRVAFLSEIRGPVVHPIDDHTLRIEGPEEPLLEGFFGKMGCTNAHGRQEGDEFDAGTFRAKITRVINGHVREVLIRFAEPLTSEHYRFIWCTPAKNPTRCEIDTGKLSRIGAS